jgi:hypothetical protein
VASGPIALHDFEEILLKKAEVKFAWKNYVIQNNSINPLTQSVRIRTIFYVTWKARNSVTFRDNRFLFFPLKEDANDYLSQKLQLPNSFDGRTKADLLRE